MNASEAREWAEARGLLGTVLGVAAGHHVTLAELWGRSRTPRVSRARQALWSRLEGHGLSRSEIGRAFNRDHTTIISGIAAADKRALSAGPGEAKGGS